MLFLKKNFQGWIFLLFQMSQVKISPFPTIRFKDYYSFFSSTALSCWHIYLKWIIMLTEFSVLLFMVFKNYKNLDNVLCCWCCVLLIFHSAWTNIKDFLLDEFLLNYPWCELIIFSFCNISSSYLIAYVGNVNFHLFKSMLYNSS